VDGIAHGHACKEHVLPTEHKTVKSITLQR